MRGQVTSAQTLTFAALVGGTGLYLLYAYVNPLVAVYLIVLHVGTVFGTKRPPVRR